MNYELTKDTARLARQYSLKPDELAFADLLAAGWDSHDAYALTIRTGYATWTKKALADEITRLRNLEGVKKRIDDLTHAYSRQQEDKIREAISAERDNLLKRATSKEDMLVTLMARREALPPDSPDWLKVNQQIIDVSRMKQDEVKTDDNTVHYYLPVNYPTSCRNCLHSRCPDCRYFKAYQKKMKNEKPTINNEKSKNE